MPTETTPVAARRQHGRRLRRRFAAFCY